jgi:thiosulfate dehydrogenase
VDGLAVVAAAEKGLKWPGGGTSSSAEVLESAPSLRSFSGTSNSALLRRLRPRRQCRSRRCSRAALHAHSEEGANEKPPIEPDGANLLAGADVYRHSCAFCHSLPGHGKTEVETGMYPTPPMLLTGEGVRDDPPGETHWVIKNGIRMTGMPAFVNTLSDRAIRQVTLLLARSHELPPAVQHALTQPDSIPVAGSNGGPIPLTQAH